MIHCNNCGHEIPDTDRFCSVCGTPVGAVPVAPAPVIGIEQEKECLDNFHRLLKYERLSWKISGIVTLVISCFLGFLSLVYFALSATEEMFAFLGGYLFVYTILFLPVAIINLKMVKKAEYYMNIVYNDVTPVAERCGNVGMIVLSAIFNEIAMIFIIINFVRVKNNKAIIESAAARQQEFRNNQ